MGRWRGKFHSLPQTHSEQRSKHYADIEQLLIPGFLSYMVNVGGINLSLRSLSTGDLFLLRHRIGRKSYNAENEWRIWAIATSVWVLDGQVILGNFGIVPKLANLFRRTSKQILSILFNMILSLYDRTSKASRGIESYCYEQESRYLWFSHGKQVPNANHITGIPGTESLGINHLQKIWQYLNQMEDIKTTERLRWQNAKYIASASNPKGVKQANSQDNIQRQREERHQQEIHDKFYYWTTGVLDDDYASIEGFNIFRKKTVEDLKEEYRRWVEGDEDLHDYIVRKYKEEIRERYEKHRRLQEENIKMLQGPEELDPVFARPRTSLVGITPDQLIALTKQRGQQMGPKKVQSLVGDDYGRHLYQKFIKDGEAKPPPGGLRIDSNGRVVPIRQQSELTEKLRDRPPTISEKPGR